MPRPTPPKDLYVSNGWYLEIPGLTSPHFETLEGIQRNSNDVEIVDAGTNKKHKFGTQIIDFGDMTITRTRQGTPDDALISAIARECIERGLKIPVVAVKMHKQVEVFRIVFDGFRFKTHSLPTFDVNSEDKFIESFGATCDGWDEV